MSMWGPKVEGGHPRSYGEILRWLSACMRGRSGLSLVNGGCQEIYRKMASNDSAVVLKGGFGNWLSQLSRRNWYSSCAFYMSIIYLASLELKFYVIFKSKGVKRTFR